MITNMDLAILTLLAVLGALLVAIAGWTDSGEPFNIRKFYPSILRAITAGIIVVLGYQTVSSVDTFDFLLVFIAGMGIDAGGKRITDTVKTKVAGTTSTPA